MLTIRLKEMQALALGTGMVTLALQEATAAHTECMQCTNIKMVGVKNMHLYTKEQVNLLNLSL